MQKIMFSSMGLMIACAGTEKLSDSEGSVEMPPPMVNVNITVLQAGGGGLAGVALNSSWDTALTDNVGSAQIKVEQGAPFIIEATLAEHLMHRFQGTAGQSDFDLVSFMGNTMTMGQINQQLGIVSNSAKGLVVIALDRPNLSPAVGASVELDAASEQPYAIGAMGGSFTDTLGASHMGALIFANVDPGSVVATPSHESLNCLSNPGEESAETIEVEAATVNVGFFICD